MTELINDLEKMPVGKLLAYIGRMQSIRTDRYMDSTGLFRGQALLLMTLADQDGLTHSELAEKLEISPAAATKVIKRMEALNYLQRQSDPADERISRVYLLEEGWAVIQHIRSVFAKVNLILLHGFSAEEQATLTSMLARLYVNLLDQTFDPS